MSVATSFNESFYLSNNADVVLAISQGHFSSALQHYQLFGGKNELRDPNATFDASYYASKNSDVLSAVSAGQINNVFEHYIAFGEKENRAPSVTYENFTASAYLTANADVKAAVDAGTIASALDHYIAFGASESRSGSGIAAVASGTTYTLTTDDDAFTGTANDDTFNAALATFEAADVIDGGAGTDTLNARVNGTIGAPTVVAVENLKFNTVGTTTLSLANVSGFTGVTVTGTGNFDFGLAATDNLSLLPTYTLTDFDKTLTLSHADDTFGSQKAGEAVLDFALSGVDGGTIQIDLATSTGTDEVIDNLKIASNGSTGNEVTLSHEATIDAITKTTITGSADLELTVNDATAVAGGGSFMDAPTIAAGAHTGVLSLVTDTATVDLTKGTGVDNLILTGTTTGTQTLQKGTNVEFRAATAGADVTLSVLKAGDAGSTADSLTVKLNAAANMSVGAGNDLVVASVETISINSTTTASDKSTVTNTIADLNASTLSTLNITGDTNLTITATTKGIDTVAAGDFTGKLSLNLSTGNDADTVAAAITSGSGDDTIVGSAQADNISTGAGADTITVGAGADTVTTGAGSDTVIIAQASAAANKLTDFTTGSGGDLLQLVAGAAQDTNTVFEGTGDSGGAGSATNGLVFVQTGASSVIDTSGNAAADLTAINNVFFQGGDESASAAEVIVIFNDDTDGDGTADQVSAYVLHETDGAADGFNTAEAIAIIGSITAGTDLAGKFVDGNFELI